MKRYTMYVCENCGYESKDFYDMERHEAHHLGLTVEELRTYKNLKSCVTRMGTILSLKNNSETNYEFDKVIDALIRFEKEHGIEN